ncbi:MAG: hypothetical protein ACOYO1_05085 [Bacteroidales bacterium]
MANTIRTGITGTSENAFYVGDGTSDGYKYIYVDNADADKPAIRWNETESAWQFCSDGATWSALGSGAIIPGTDAYQHLEWTGTDWVPITNITLPSTATIITKNDTSGFPDELVLQGGNNSSSSGGGGLAVLAGGKQLSGNGDGGSVGIVGGASSGDGYGGFAIVLGGHSSGIGSGSVMIMGGSGFNSTPAGSVYIGGGQSDSGTYGSTYIYGSSGNNDHGVGGNLYLNSGPGTSNGQIYIGDNIEAASTGTVVNFGSIDNNSYSFINFNSSGTAVGQGTRITSDLVFISSAEIPLMITPEDSANGTNLIFKGGSASTDNGFGGAAIIKGGDGYSSVVPGAGGNVEIYSGQPGIQYDTTVFGADGGDIFIVSSSGGSSGDFGTNAGNGGNLYLTSGSGGYCPYNIAGSAGDIRIQAGEGGSTAFGTGMSGGNVYITAGGSSLTDLNICNGGDIIVDAGKTNGALGYNGKIIFGNKATSVVQFGKKNSTTINFLGHIGNRIISNVLFSGSNKQIAIDSSLVDGYTLMISGSNANTGFVGGSIYLQTGYSPDGYSNGAIIIGNASDPSKLDTTKLLFDSKDGYTLLGPGFQYSEAESNMQFSNDKNGPWQYFVGVLNPDIVYPEEAMNVLLGGSSSNADAYHTHTSTTLITSGAYVPFLGGEDGYLMSDFTFDTLELPICLVNSPGMIKDLRIKMRTPCGAVSSGKSITFTVRVNGTDTNIVAVINEIGLTEYNSSCEPVIAGDTISIRVETSAGSTPEDIIASLNLVT